MGKRNARRFVAGLLSAILSCSAFVWICRPISVSAFVAIESGVVKYQPVAYDVFLNCIEGHIAPACTISDETTGYLFGGWYKDDGGVATAIENSEDADSGDSIVAKFVPARLTGVFCQNKADVSQEGVNSTKLRMVSSVDSLNYSEVGFNIYGREKKADGSYADWLMYGHGAVREAKSTAVYAGLQVYKIEGGVPVKDGDPKTPVDLWGDDAANFMFFTYSITNIPKASYGTIIAIKPYWVTLDGTYVEGIGEFDRVQDGIDGIINISVNTKNATALAAGILKVAYDQTAFEYVEAEPGKVLDEMYFEADPDGGIVKSAGVTSTAFDTTNPNDVYLNLRFRKTGSNSYGAGEALFQVTVPDGGFSNSNESIHTGAEAWDVRY